MKKILLLSLLALFCHKSIAQHYKTIQLTANKFVILAFSSDIVATAVGFDPANFILKNSNQLLQIQPLIPFTEETNLMVQTADNSIYMFNLVYTAPINELFYNIDISKAENYTMTSPIAPIVSRDNPTPQANITPQAPSVISSSNTQTAIPDNDPILLKVAKENGYITMGNGVRVKNFEVYLKGIYTHGDYMYFQILVSNNSTVRYNFDYIGFFKVVKATKKGVSHDTSQLDIIYSYIPKPSLIKEETIIVCKLDKFSISPEKQIRIDLSEGDGGERNISFPIDYDIILTARSI